MHAAGDEARDVRGVEEEQRAHLVGDLAEGLGVDDRGYAVAPVMIIFGLSASVRSRTWSRSMRSSDGVRP